jgi:predicted transposase/invertase (TIGR01784 family)
MPRTTAPSIPFYPPSLDIVFRALFSMNEPLLRSMLEAILRPTIPIRSIDIEDPGLLPPTIDGKSVVLDLHLRLDDGSRVDVEMQCRSERAMLERIAF